MTDESVKTFSNYKIGDTVSFNLTRSGITHICHGKITEILNPWIYCIARCPFSKGMHEFGAHKKSVKLVKKGNQHGTYRNKTNGRFVSVNYAKDNPGITMRVDT